MTINKLLCNYLKENNFVNGKDYVIINTKNYLIILPFKFEILHPFSRWNYQSNLPRFLRHCVCSEKKYFDYYFEHNFLNKKMIKVFFFKKGIKIKTLPNYETKKTTIPYEFTCWLSEKDKHTHMFWNQYNNFKRDRYDEIIYNKASKIIQKYYDIIFQELKKYDLKEIEKNVNKTIKKGLFPFY